MERHEPVLLEEIMQYLNPQPNNMIIDATLGMGGHAARIAERILPHGQVVGIERDPALLEHVKKIANMTPVVGNMSQIKQIATSAGIEHPDAILFDIGINIFHVTESGRGFSFQKNEVLDMRFGPDAETTAKELLSSMSEKELARIIKEYGEERFAGPIAKRISEARKRESISTTADLIRVIAGAVPAWYRKGKRHFATKTFQALRIAVNRELDHVRIGIQAACDIVREGGRVAVLSYHSLEHKLVKNIFRAREDGFLVTKHVVTPSRKEQLRNPRSRSAQLRVWEKAV